MSEVKKIATESQLRQALWQNLVNEHEDLVVLDADLGGSDTDRSV